MGIIIRQSIKGSIVNLAGIGIAAISTLFIYPKYSELYGFAQFITSTAYLLVPFASLGILGSLTKFFPIFKTDNNSNNGFLAIIFTSLIIVFSTFSLFYLTFNKIIAQSLNAYSKNSTLIDFGLLSIILLLCLVLIINYIYSNYAANYQRIAIPQVITQFSVKVYLPIAIILSTILSTSFMQFGFALILFYTLQIVAQHIYLSHLGVLSIVKPNWKFINKDLLKEILNYKIFATFNQLGYVFAFRIDMFMIPIFLSYSSNGIYAIMLFISNIIELPARSVISIADPIISKAWSENDMQEINSIYKKSALNLLIPGAAIFCLIWFGFDQIASISSDSTKFLIGKYAFLFLGLGKLLDLTTSVNNQIIIYSPYYKYNLIFILLLGLINISLNIGFIEEYGITGAAFASFSAYLIYNLVKLLFIHYKFSMHPFTKELGIVFLLAIGICGLLYLVPNQLGTYSHLVINGLIVGCIYFPIIYSLKLSRDLNHLINLAIGKVKNYLSK